MASTTEDARRASRLNGFFRDVLSGKRKIRASRDAQLFIESIRSQGSPSVCAELLAASRPGLDGVRYTVRVDLSPPFVCSHTLPLLRYFSDSGIKSLVGGQLLRDILVAIAEPPTFWTPLVELFHARGIPQEGLDAFAWLTLELLSLPTNTGVDIFQDALEIDGKGWIMEAKAHSTREIAYQIKKQLELRTSPAESGDVDGPGGRHDNDHADIRKIEIYPTTDEFLSTKTPFYRTAKEVFNSAVSDRRRVHIDNLFRLSREDMLPGLCENMKDATGKKNGQRKPQILGMLALVGLKFGNGGKYINKATVKLQCNCGLEILEKLSETKRKKLLKDNPNLIRHEGFGALCHGREILGFAVVDRDVDLLAQWPPIVSLRFTSTTGLYNSLLALASASSDAQFVLVDTPVFAFEPVLKRLQAIADLPLHQALLDIGHEVEVQLDSRINRLIEVLYSGPKIDEGTVDLSRVMSLVGVATDTSRNPTKIDECQRDSLCNALGKALTLIQGPPGTGKSFIGAQIVKCLYELSWNSILIISYTNHALDQFLEDLLKVGIPQESMVRIGSRQKCTAAVLPLLLSEQKNKSAFRRSQATWTVINASRGTMEELKCELEESFDYLLQLQSTLSRHNISFWDTIRRYLEFSEDCQYYDALLVPDDTDGWSRAGGGGRRIASDYLFQRWRQGQGPGMFQSHFIASPNSQNVWGMNKKQREMQIQIWMKAILDEHVATIRDMTGLFNDAHDRLQHSLGDRDFNVIENKRIIACTTTGAAKYASLIQAARPDVILVEEAGEILESHILTAMTPSVRQLILIGDHKQLRPKVNNYALTVEKGDGFDLNMSLFERLILQGASYTTLQKQHRMASQISLFPRMLTYPDLLDGPNTASRPAILGLQDRVVFVNHGKQEESNPKGRDILDQTATSSKTNLFEAEMLLRCIKYFTQQGYGPDKMVVLTPYLGQLRALRALLQHSYHGSKLSERDKLDLLKAGLLDPSATQHAATANSTPLRISTIDNYQGEESDLVIASLTRSNEAGDIGFMAQPERLNVLITRARNGMVLIGNMATFANSKKGGPAWQPFFKILEERGHLYEGLPIVCSSHPKTKAILKEPADFDKYCPDGGCTEPCGTLLACGIHKCKSRCHWGVDHSKAECREILNKTCERQHKIRVTCSRQKETCHKCLEEDKEQERQIRRNFKLEEARLKREESFQKEFQALQDEIDLQRRILKCETEEKEQQKTLAQHREDLASLKDTQARLKDQKAKKAQQEMLAAQYAAEVKKKQPNFPSADDQNDGPKDARSEWEREKKLEGSKNTALDNLMNLIGLEAVKGEFLSIKSKVDTTLRQGTSLENERFNCSLLGNPGTGKTTVARIYAQFLTSVGVIPGACFKETTGASLAHGGVAGCKNLIDEILEDGGGVLFIDEAYQLSSGNSPGGKAVMDYLLPEAENLKGKVVFLLAGYNRQMESFFAHNPGFPSRFPIELQFADYTDDELLQILELKINAKYSSRMKCDDGLRGLYSRIVVRRIGQGRGKDGFGNARTVENVLATITRRQADRIRKQRRMGSKPDDFLLTKEDLIGPEPADALTKCEAWQRLMEMVGLVAVKEALKSLVDSITENYQRELAEQAPIEYSLNKVFLGSPGTGKTTVAKLYGKILVDLGLLSKGEVVTKNPADFVGAHLGQSEQQTKGILAATEGKVLVIDEAYGLYGGSGESGGVSDPYKTAAIDTIVAEVQSVPGDDRCVLLLGYKEQMETMFHNVNPGLSRRFPLSSAFVFEDFTDEELRQILLSKLKREDLRATDQGIKVAMEMLSRARNRPNFGNGGEIDILLGTAKAQHQKWATKNQSRPTFLLEAQDFDPDFDRAKNPETSVRELFRDTVGGEETIKLLEGYQDTVRRMKALDMDPKENIPFNFLFRGPPGTGKTTTARKMGTVFYNLGFLASVEVIECSATDLIGQYVGQTGPKVQKLLDRALGKVLFVDEAYRLAHDGHFAKEALDELVDSVTKPKYCKKLIIILAGYEKDINRLLSVNTGLTSRFPQAINFRSLSPEECVSLLVRILQHRREELSGKVLFDLSALESPSGGSHEMMLDLFSKLTVQDNWASARDVQTLATAVFNDLLSQGEPGRGHITFDMKVLESKLSATLEERESRSKHATKSTVDSIAEAAKYLGLDTMEMASPSATRQKPNVQQASNIATDTVTGDAKACEEEELSLADDRCDFQNGVAKRDAGVSDEVWEQLLQHQAAEEEQEKEYRRLKDEANRAAGAARDQIVKRLVEEERKRREKAEKREKLKARGLCPAGYNWIDEGNGYRCAGGSHYISNEAIEAL